MLVLDRRIPAATIAKLAVTVAVLGYRELDFVVEPAFPVKRVILVELAAPDEADFAVEISEQGFSVRHGEAREQLGKLDAGGVGPRAWDLPGLTALAQRAAANDPKLRAVVSAADAVSAEVLLSTYAALLGPGCAQRTGEGCLIARLGFTSASLSEPSAEP